MIKTVLVLRTNMNVMGDTLKFWGSILVIICVKLSNCWEAKFMIIYYKYANQQPR